MPRGSSVDEVLCRVLADSDSVVGYLPSDDNVQSSGESDSAAAQLQPRRDRLSIVRLKIDCDNSTFCAVYGPWKDLSREGQP